MFSFLLTFLRFFRAIRNGFADKEFRGLLFFVVFLLIAGTAFYSSVEHWKILDSFYFSVTTLTTVGLGDFAPKTDIGKIFTVFYIFVGVGTLLSFITVVAQHANGKPEDLEIKDPTAQ